MKQLEDRKVLACWDLFSCGFFEPQARLLEDERWTLRPSISAKGS